MSGEDPYLGYEAAYHSTTGIQSQGVLATAKHYINNQQETQRTAVSADVDERTEAEIYLRPFAGAVAAEAAAMMCSYNLVNGRHACHNNRTLLGDLEGRLGFKGWVMSDWAITT